MENIDRIKKAKDLFCQGYSCSQAIVGAFCDVADMDFKIAIRLSSSFGGGMGGLRETCGAVTGMFMITGLVLGYESPTDNNIKKEHYAIIRSLADKFKSEHDSIICHELLSSLPGKLKQDPSPRTDEYYKARPCIRFVETAAKLLDELLRENNIY